jgi:hypothetical protein
MSISGTPASFAGAPDAAPRTMAAESKSFDLPGMARILANSVANAAGSWPTDGLFILASETESIASLRRNVLNIFANIISSSTSEAPLI